MEWKPTQIVNQFMENMSRKHYHKRKSAAFKKTLFLIQVCAATRDSKHLFTWLHKKNITKSQPSPDLNPIENLGALLNCDILKT